MYDPELSGIIHDAFVRLFDDIGASGEYLGTQTAAWMREVYPSDPPEEIFMQPSAFPMLLLPWYAETTIRPRPDPTFQSDLVYSTINGYYYVRLMDNLMDGHEEAGIEMLPSLNFFHTRFQFPYQQYFTDKHPFWGSFQSIWFHSAEASMRDAQLDDIDRELFQSISAQKTCAVKIPIGAVFYHYQQTERIEVWERFVELFGCWHQMRDDTFDWVKDTRTQTMTYFLSEAERRKQPDEETMDWVIREGFDWSMQTLDDWMDELQEVAAGLDCLPLEAYLDERVKLLSDQKRVAVEGMEQIAGLLGTFKRALDLEDE